MAPKTIKNVDIKQIEDCIGEAINNVIGIKHTILIQSVQYLDDNKSTRILLHLKKS